MIHFEIPKNQSSIIKVIGVGGGGSNAVNYMYNLNCQDVDFVVCNTDSQALAGSPVPNKIQLGPHLTQGLGAGANPEIGKQAGEESMEDISKALKVNTKMAFITAGMGGGTGTGGAPVVAKVCRELGILTVGIVTLPFAYEGNKRMKQAQEGINRLREYVDTILIISNDKLRQQYGNLAFTAAFAKADNVLATAAKCITDVITTSNKMNLDFADVTTVMKNGGVAILGAAQADGEQRALRAVEEAIASPLLNDNDIRGARWILLNITSAPGEFEHTLDELESIQSYLQQQAGENCDIILGLGHDESLGEKISVTVIATGFNYKEIQDLPERPKESERKIFVRLGDTPAADAATTDLQSKANEERRASIGEVSDPLAPRLTVRTTDESPMSKPLPASEQPRRFPLSLESRLEQSLAGTTPTPPQAEEPVTEMKLTIREDVPAETPLTIGGHTLSQEEMAERRSFEEQKRALEERAERLRRLSFNMKNEGADDIENVPAFVRRNVALPEGNGSQDKSFLGGMSIGAPEGNGRQATIQTINTFLDGKKPD